MVVVIPEQRDGSDVRLSGWRLRQLAEAAGYPVTQAQLDRYVEWGILGEPADDGWPPAAVERLIQTRALEAEVRSLPRRVLRLRSDFLGFPIKTEHVQRALVAVAPSVSHTRRKVAKIELALTAFGNRLARPAAGRIRAHVYPTPPQTEWRSLLADAQANLVESRVAGWYAWANWVLPAYRENGAPDLSDIPVEEQVLILAVRDLDADRRLGEWYARQSVE